jgi:hypothetical protein
MRRHAIGLSVLDVAIRGRKSGESRSLNRNQTDTASGDTEASLQPGLHS